MQLTIEHLELLRTKELSGTDFSLMLLVTLKDDGTGTWLLNDEIAGHLAASKRSVQRSLERLRMLRLVKIKWRTRTDGTQYRLLFSKWRHDHVKDARVVPASCNLTEGRVPNLAPHATDGVSESLLSSANSLTCQIWHPSPPTVNAAGFGMVVATKCIPFDTKAAKYLHQTISKNANHRLPINVRNWADVFRLMRTSDELPTNRIHAALVWHRKHCNGTYTPRVHRVKQFREKFMQLEHAMGRNGTVVQAVTITPQAQRMCDTLWQLGWRNAERGALCQAVQQTLTAYQTHYTQCKAAAPTKPTTAAQRVAAHVVRNMEPADHFVLQWWRAVHARVHNWVEWDGTVGRYVFTPHHADNMKHVRATIRNYGSNITAAAILELLGSV